MNELLEHPIFPTDEKLVATYDNKEQAARERLTQGKFGSNPNVRNPKKDKRYSISTCHFPYPTQFTSYLSEVIDQLVLMGESLCVQQKELVHLTTGEVAFSSKGGRKVLGLKTAEKVIEYYKALANHLPVYEPTPKLPLWKLIPILDNPSSDSSSFTIAATFLTDGSDTPFRITYDIKKSIDDFNDHQENNGQKLVYSARLSQRDALLIAIARPARKPTPRQISRILEILDQANSSIPNCSTISLDNITMLSTFRYVPSTRHAYLDPPIDLTTLDRDTSNIRILTPQGFVISKQPISS